MTAPKVSIIVLNWNGLHDTKECLYGLREITYTNYETIVVDNGSRDGSPEVLRKAFPEVKILENFQNLGFAGGMNTGIQHALLNGSEFIFLLNNDTVSDPEILTELVKACGSQETIGATVPKIYQYHRPQILWTCGVNLNYGPFLISYQGFGEFDHGQYSCPQSVEAFSGCGVLLKKAAIEAVGQLDTQFFMYCEDLDWSLRFRRAGYTIMFVPEAKMWHKGAAISQFKPHEQKSKYLGESIIRFMRKNAGKKEWLIFLSKTALWFPIVFLRNLLRGDRKAFFAKIKSAVKATLK